MKSLCEIRKKVLNGERIDKEEALELYRLPLPELGELAHQRRIQKKKEAYGGQGDRIVTYIIERNINYTNVCNVGCRFCAFYRRERDPDSYVLSYEEISKKIRELEELGGVQILLQGGHHPKLGLDYYLGLLHHIRVHHPTINIHGFSPPEFQHLAKVFRMSVAEVLQRFREAGLGSIPGGGAEILVDSVRKTIAPRKCSSEEWLEVMRIAHRMGLRSSATMMFGHKEGLEDRVEHLDKIRSLQDETGGFTVFICWTFQPDRTAMPMEKTGAAEYLRMQALARIYLDNFDNIQSSWVTQGPEIGQLALFFGANDFGSVMIEENVVASAGTIYRLDANEIERLIREAGYLPRRRNNWYQLLN
ncbi:cyclic dehypoxanthinyl futalosine synthase [Candidatus Methylacidithermus pantelleriae]|uniref:Cyclic dehypoxanthine futalosine synthase n=1 Tax=Candidatus Methylacidithermus pantelleriae TaxID=2744239 RepID=A0A8J2BPG5_9BACT|nr:cyclic dehypoxanthinyl futalosine synthase [Candidatus Methylacidithermus pantelleriae]CAF0701014.1 Cyclic dehypoxanthine futalosine synthase [Candidatus Methylacidithermus pantelleriae]